MYFYIRFYIFLYIILENMILNILRLRILHFKEMYNLKMHL